MPQVVVATNWKAVARALDEVTRKQVPFATAAALTFAARDGRDDVRRSLGDKFTIRSKGVALGFKSSRAQKRDWPNIRVEVGTEDEFWRLHETGGVKKPRQGKTLAIPTRATRRGKSGKIPESRRPRALISKGKAVAIEGAIVKKRTKRSRARGGASNLNTLYLRRPKARIDRRLGMLETVQRSLALTYEKHFQVQLEAAIKSARVREGSFSSEQGRVKYLKALGRA